MAGKPGREGKIRADCEFWSARFEVSA